MSSNSPKPEDALYLLSFLDVVDRLDILLLEIRHLQQNIIHSLRAPALYLPLRYEEPYLFGQDWHETVTHSKDSTDDIRLLKDWIIRYPTPDLAMRFYNTQNEKENSEYIREEENVEKSEIKARVHHIVGMIWAGDNWARQQRRQYHALYALQILKQQIMRDKLALSRSALQARLTKEGVNRGSLDKSAFMILRQGVLHHIARYVSILKNHKQQMAESIEFGIDRNPAPSTVRRRDLGIFMDFLANRSNDIQRDILHLLTHFDQPEDMNKHTMLLFHGWSHDERVSNVQMFDKVNQLFNETHVGEKKRKQQHVGYVNTSFWTPDRPDLQPIIANPIAKTIINNVFQELDDVALSDHSDDFTGLLVKIKRELSEWAAQHSEIQAFREKSTHFIREIASDFLAASVKGTSYLYALYLLRIGDGLENQLDVGGTVKLDMVEALEQGTAPFDEQIAWYLRLRLTASWVRASNKAEEVSELDEMLINGVETVTQNLLDFLIDHKQQNRISTGVVWIELCNSLVTIISKSSVTKKTSKWRYERGRDYWFEGCKKEGKKQFPRSTRRLNIRLQNFLFRELLVQKRVANKPLGRYQEHQLEEAFNELYPLEIEAVPIPNAPGNFLRHPKHLFRHMYDIPYQSSLLRSIDMLHHALNPKALFYEMHWDVELGRGLFALALEFYAREIESPEHRLSLCINQVVFLYFSLSQKSGKGNMPLANILENWVRGSGYERDFNKKVFLRDSYMRLCDRIDDISATKINTVFSEIRKHESHNMRKLEQLAGRKLQRLLDILLDLTKDNMLDEKTDVLLTALIQFLSIRRNPKQHARGQAKAGFYNEMLHAFGDISPDKKKEFQTVNKGALLDCFLPKRMYSVMIHRHSITNYYPVPDPMGRTLQQKLKSPFENRNGQLLADILQKKPWENKDIQHKGCLVHADAAFKTKSWVTLGRFSAISKTSVRLPCKCPLPRFLSDVQREQHVYKEAFPPHFNRREITLPLQILGQSNDHDNVFALLSLSLQRRSMRLDILYRLLRAISDSHPHLKSAALEMHIEHMHSQGIKLEAFLTDGWGDILFFLSVDKNTTLRKKHIDGVFDYQEAIFEDFMVDRTEILFTPQCLDQVSDSDDYDVSLELRIMEDRWLEKSISQHEQHCKKLMTAAGKAHSIESVSMNKLPGRSDYIMRFKGKTGAIGVYSDLIRWLDGEYAEDRDEINIMRTLDHIETCIEKVVITDE
ncbi:MAG: Unknown protein [uncultured Thiotrichaceae bacterium]|uniref:Uncharacterized protein n=1 Tax=uncultured Thiotrichaceae bacterium TaxID=298394 RepID=A0A6S6U9N6_9GAMM|nr:MAG: Unknown protein [uncultured Thiotrichaceae bacterium]